MQVKCQQVVVCPKRSCLHDKLMPDADKDAYLGEVTEGVEAAYTKAETECSSKQEL